MLRISASPRHCCACSAVSPAVVDEQRGDRVGRHLVELVDDAHHAVDVGGADAGVEALDQLAVVDLEPHRRQRQRDQRLGHHPGDLDVVVEARVVAHRRRRCRPA